MLIKQLLIEGIYKNLLNGEFLCNGDRVSVWDDEKLLEMGGGMVPRQCEHTQCH